MKEPKFVDEEGWLGNFTRDEYEGAKFKNGTRIKKVWGEIGDGTPLGTEGTVLGSIGGIEFPANFGVKVAYFVEWDNRPKCAVFVIDKKLGAA